MRYALLIGVFLVFRCTSAGWAQVADPMQNADPEVHITVPSPDQVLRWSTSMPFSIEVSDKEDGLSIYGEIRNQEVLLAVRILPDTAHPERHLATVDDLLPPSLHEISRSTCFDCHRPHEPLIGPSFQAIAQKYADAPSSIQDTLVQRVLAGSTGFWGEQKMPPHPELSRQKVLDMIHWILTMDNDKNHRYYVGLDGAVKIPDPPVGKEAGWCMLTALYRERSTPIQPAEPKTGHHHMILTIKR